MKTPTIVLLVALSAAGALQAGELSPALEDQLLDLGRQDVLKVLVVMKEQSDMSVLDLSLKEEGARLADRHRRVVSDLRNTAARSRTGLLADLEARIAAKGPGRVLGYTPHWILNSVVVVADETAIRDLARREDVAVVEPDLVPEIIEPLVVKAAPGRVGPDKQGGFVTPGVEAVNAPRVWHELGIDGTGSLVANLDSGVDADHPAFGARWRGHVAPAAQCWADHGGAGSPDYPIDLHGHGTHTMGTMTGVTDTDTLGVAPGAMWIASNAPYLGSGSTAFDNVIIAAFEFFADPDGDPETHDDVPDVVNNSWGVNSTSGYPGCDSRWWEVIDHCEAAGVVVVWATGNEGPAPMSVRVPADRATTPTNCFSVGSVSAAFPHVTDSFSSRGPSACSGFWDTKPEVAAPGNNVLSTLPQAGYGYMTGTSMATPHVAGVVALMRQANPDLDVVTIKEILMETAVDSDITGEDNFSGHGMIDAYAAVFSVLGDIGTLSGTVRDADTDEPLPGAEVLVLGGFAVTTTGANGAFSFELRQGTIELRASRFGYESTEITVEVVAGEETVVDIPIAILPLALVDGVVYDPAGVPVPGATVAVKDVPVATSTTDTEGRYALSLPYGDGIHYEIVASAPGLATALVYMGLDGDRTLDIHLPFELVESFESGAFSAYPWVLGGDALPVIDVTEAYEGFFSARMGDVPDDRESEMSLGYYVLGDGELSFHVKVESEAGYDGLVFSLDGQVYTSWSGDHDWTRVDIPLSTGPHTFTWTYTKDGSVSYLRDTAWLDRIVFPGTGVSPVPEILVEQDNVQSVLDTGGSEVLPLRVTNVGGYRLDFTTSLEVIPLPLSAAPAELLDADPSTLPRLDGGTDKAEAPSWVDVTPVTGAVHPGVGVDLLAAFDATGLAGGNHFALLSIVSTDPETPLVTVPLILTVDDASGASDTPAAPGLRLSSAPNPFNPTTEIAFETAAAAQVDLSVYDVTGRRVRRLLSEAIGAGSHRAVWDGRDAGGRAVASGVYFARLAAGPSTKTISLVLVR
jgi:subtilisin family serine protease